MKQFRLTRMPNAEPSTLALLRVRHALRTVTEPRPEPEIMTLSEVSDYLRLDRDMLEALTPALPVFVLSGQFRVRRTALLRWIEEREQDYGRMMTASRACNPWSIRLETGAA